MIKLTKKQALLLADNAVRMYHDGECYIVSHPSLTEPVKIARYHTINEDNAHQWRLYQRDLLALKLLGVEATNLDIHSPDASDHTLATLIERAIVELSRIPNNQ